MKQTDGSIVELEFALEESEFFLARASGEAAYEFELETITPRSDGSVLEFLTVRGVEPGQAETLLASSPGICEVQLVYATDDEAFFECVSDSQIATALADEQTIVKRITARSGEGRLVAEVPPHVDASAVIDSFLAEYPGAELLARRQTDRRAPKLTEPQFLTGLLSELTEKQFRAVRVAHANGYFDWPREHTADEIADMLSVSTPTFTEHLRVAERKLLDEIFD
ncbi:bacterio-opsin activator domain-containing protein [Halosimplex aquaticum]|uniref:Bacterio-opsin activator domain-containing protein n=1 Tax=Halosimplex aquaticum TaxID=3026162 RepID=A0ABD5XWA1_9EURY|nr:bacterio-opsin activator domain-containing protein [Halosimplex aquaticum]